MALWNVLWGYIIPYVGLVMIMTFVAANLSRYLIGRSRWNAVAGDPQRVESLRFLHSHYKRMLMASLLVSGRLLLSAYQTGSIECVKYFLSSRTWPIWSALTVGISAVMAALIRG
jgi:hypothetical protein